LREQLLDAQMRLELGELTPAEFAGTERDLLARIREIRGGASQGAISMRSGARSVEIETFEPHRR
jgi:hypothetical protein